MDGNKVTEKSEFEKRAFLSFLLSVLQSMFFHPLHLLVLAFGDKLESPDYTQALVSDLRHSSH